MKINLKQISYMFLSLVLFLSACDTEESFQITKPEAKFTLNAPSINTIFLNFALPENPAFTINWEDEVTETSSYEIEMATDADFTSPKNLGTSQTKEFTMSVSNFNDVLKSVGVTSYENTAVYFRVKAGDKISNSILMLVTKYAVEVPEITAPDNSFTVTLSDVDPEAVAMTVTWNDPEISNNSSANITYDAQIAPAGTNFAEAGSLATTNEVTASIAHASLNEIALAQGATAGEQSNFDVRIVATVKTDSGDLVRTSTPITIAITPYETVLPPTLYVVGAGAADAGWGWDTPVELQLQGKVYVGNIKLTPENGGNFRFFTEKDNWGSGQNYTYYEIRGYTFDSNLVNANDGDKNFQFIGTAGEYSIRIDTENETITLDDPITSVYQVSTWGIVGSGANDWGNAGKDIPFYTTNQSNVFAAYPTLVDGEIKFRENNDWGNNLGDNGADGSLEASGDNIAVTAGTYKVTLNLNDNTYSIEPYSWGIVGSAYNNWGATPDAKMYYDYTTDTFKVGVKLTDGEFKFRFNNNWDVNLGSDGTSSGLSSGGDNITVTAGYYMISINVTDNSYTIQPASIYGIVGSGYNDWGASPDFLFTEVQSGVWKAENVTLLDGEIKFRVNENWDVNYGKGASDGTLEAGGGNIPVTAGTYRIMLDFNTSSYTLAKLN